MTHVTRVCLTAIAPIIGAWQASPVANMKRLHKRLIPALQSHLDFDLTVGCRHVACAALHEPQLKGPRNCRRPAVPQYRGIAATLENNGVVWHGMGCYDCAGVWNLVAAAAGMLVLNSTRLVYHVLQCLSSCGLWLFVGESLWNLKD